MKILSAWFSRGQIRCVTPRQSSTPFRVSSLQCVMMKCRTRYATTCDRNSFVSERPAEKPT